MIEATFQIPRNLWKSMNRSARNHGHLARVRRDIQELAGWKLRSVGAKPLEGRVAVEWTVSYPAGVSWTHGDPTNALPVTKPILDAAVNLGIIEGDGPKTVVYERFWRGQNLPTKNAPHEITLVIRKPSMYDFIGDE